MYFDNSSTTKINRQVIETMTKVMENFWANPSSLHSLGAQAEKLMRQSRQILAQSLGVSADEIYFTASGTESCNLFIKGALEAYQQRGRHIIASSIEHPAVLKTLRAYEDKGWEVSWLKVDQEGFISLKELEEKLREDTVLTAIMHVNNELGSIQPIEEAGRIIKEKSRSVFFVDGVQGFLKLPLDIEGAYIDGYSISGHKIHGPKASAALYVRRGRELVPLLHGGGQERNLRSGTENLPAIAGLAKAVQIFSKGDNFAAELVERQKEKDKFASMLEDMIPTLKINSAKGLRNSPYILNLSLPSIQGETILHALEEAKIYVSTGSACSSKEKDYSHVLMAAGLDEEDIKGAIRISFGLEEWPDEEKLSFFANKLKEIYERLR